MVNKKEKKFLIILDGWGHGPRRNADAIAQANIPFINSLYQKYPNSELVTYGEAVGLPEGQMGNSEVGHLNIGAGRIVYQELVRINKSIREKELDNNPVLVEALQYAKDNNKPVHLIGLVSDGGVHSHIDHLLGICEILENSGIQNSYIHAFMDGRDTDPRSGIGYLQTVLNHIKDKPTKLASVVGRYYAMDRDKRWERIKLAYDLLVKGIGESSSDILETLKNRYEKDETDEFLKPITITIDGHYQTIKEDDVVICFNFRTDRPREITMALHQQDFPDYEMQKLPLKYICMTEYDKTFKNVGVLYKKENLQNTLGEYLSSLGKTQVRIAETEKYAHVTYFFSGGREEEFSGEKRILIPSPKVATYDLKPEMSANEVTDAILEEIEQNKPEFICLNFANADMVGHTGIFSAAQKAVETVSKNMERLIEKALEYDYEGIVIADHGNSDFMINSDGSPNTAHSMNPVPCFYISNNPKTKNLKDGKLADIAPTILSLYGLKIPDEMDGNVLL